MSEFFVFFIILFASFFFSSLFQRFHLPWVVALIIAGIVLGPHGLGWFQPNETMDILGQIGVIFLMFMAGLEIQMKEIEQVGREAVQAALLNGIVPFMIGIALMLGLGYGLHTAILTGIIFISTSIAVVLPILEKSGLSNNKFGSLVIVTTMLEDILSLLLLSFFLNILDHSFSWISLLFLIAPFAVIRVIRPVIPKLNSKLHPRKTLVKYFRKKEHDHDMFQQELRLVITILFGSIIIFELIGLHNIVGGFFAGMILSDVLSHDKVVDKVQTIAYGLFIPIFFMMVGAQTELDVFWEMRDSIFLVSVLFISAIGSKFLTGWLAGHLEHLKPKRSILMGIATIPKLSTTLAVAYTGSAYGIIDRQLLTSLIMLSIVSTLTGAMLLNKYSD